MEMIASWVAPVATTIAALMTASNLGTRITGWGFAVFLIGSIAWGILGLVTDQPSLVWQNVILSILNLFGIWRWLGRQARIEEGARIADDREFRLRQAGRSLRRGVDMHPARAGRRNPVPERRRLRKA